MNRLMDVGQDGFPDRGLLLLLTGSIADAPGAEPESDQEAPPQNLEASRIHSPRSTRWTRKATWRATWKDELISQEDLEGRRNRGICCIIPVIPLSGFGVVSRPPGRYGQA